MGPPTGRAIQFFFQTRSAVYNILSAENAELIARIRDLGHIVGLHAYVAQDFDQTVGDLSAELATQRLVLESILESPVTVFSFHRPPARVLEFRQDRVAGMINAYGPSFFEYSRTPASIHYYADSRHSFDYGHPLDEPLRDKLQLLLHPDEWTEEGLGLIANFESLRREHLLELNASFSREADHYDRARRENDR